MRGPGSDGAERNIATPQNIAQRNNNAATPSRPITAQRGGGAFTFRAKSEQIPIKTALDAEENIIERQNCRGTFDMCRRLPSHHAALASNLLVDIRA